MKKNKLLHLALAASFAVYLFFLLYILYFRTPRSYGSYLAHLRHSCNLIPFAGIAEYFIRLANGRINPSLVFFNLVGNTVLFFPMGLLLPVFAPKWRGGKFFALGVGIITAAELVQYLSALGSLDVDDILLNTLGLFLGYLTFTLLSKLRRSSL